MTASENPDIQNADAPTTPDRVLSQLTDQYETESPFREVQNHPFDVLDRETIRNVVREIIDQWMSPPPTENATLLSEVGVIIVVIDDRNVWFDKVQSQLEKEDITPEQHYDDLLRDITFAIWQSTYSGLDTWTKEQLNNKTDMDIEYVIPVKEA